MKNFLIILTSTLLLSGISKQCEAQRDYRNGYIITLQQDTIRGLILHTGVANISKECVFKKNAQDNSVKYKPFDITGFRFDEGKYYISKELPLRSGAKSFFAEYLIKGKSNIYYCCDEDDHYFIEIENGKIYELTEPEKIFGDENTGSYYAPKLYTNKLKVLMKDCNNIDKEIDNTILTHASLIKLSKKYHEGVCDSEKCIIFERKLKQRKYNYGFDASTSLSKLHFGKYVESQFSTVVSAGGHISISPVLFSDEKLSLQLDLIIQKHSNYTLINKSKENPVRVIYKNIDYYINSDRVVQYSPTYFLVKKLNVNMNILAVKLPLSFNYTFLISRLRPYLGIGFSNMLIFNQNKDFIYTETYDKYKKSIPTFLIGGIGNGGIKYRIKNNKDILFGFSYERLFNTEINQIQRVSNEQIYFKIGYNF